MKKTLCILSLLCAGIAAAASTPSSAYPVIYSPEAGGPVANPAYAARHEAPAAASGNSATAYHELSRYTLNLNIGYGFRATPDSKYACDVATVELEGAYYLAPHHALTLSAGFAGGGETHDYWVRDRHDFYPFTDSYDRSSFLLMGGYRFSQMLGRYFIVQVGAKCGMDVQTISVDYGYGWRGYDYPDSRSKTSVGMAYAGYVNLGAFVTRHVCLHVGYQYLGSTAKPAVDNNFPDTPKCRTSSMRWHEVHAGMTFHF